MVVDDEPIARRTLRLMLAADPEIELIGECESLEAAERIPRERPDLLFLDVQMPGLDGFELLERVGIETVPAVVFVTAYDRHALRAFDFAAADYLLKPFDDERLAATLRRVKSELAGARGAERPAADAPAGSSDDLGPMRRFLVREVDRLIVVRAEDVDWIEAADYYACLHVGAKQHLLRVPLTELERRLDPARFARVHRSSIVNLDRVREVVSHGKGEYVLVLGTGAVIRLGRGRLEELERKLAH